jgi:ABC-type uncharacterized transport system permease subunit
MSIRIVHIVFIIASTITAFGFAAWGIVEYQTTSSVADLAMALGSIAVGIALIVYGNKFFKKLKTLKSVRAL